MSDLYFGREQTAAKHFILRRYLQALAFKVLTFSDIAYVDGFSGPWKSRSGDFSDSSFMIALAVLRDAQAAYLATSGRRRRIRCFFSENDPAAFASLDRAVAPFHRPDELFEVATYRGKFEDAVPNIQSFVGTCFPLIFIDPTGWTGYPWDKIKPLFLRGKCEVLVNFMYDHINRFAHSPDPAVIESMAPILGGEGWLDRLDCDLPRGRAVEQLFRDTLKAAGNFRFVVSTKIDKADAERPHFFIAYGTKNEKGLIAFRDTEYAALRKHAVNKQRAKEKRREALTRTEDMFAGYDAEAKEASVDEEVADHKARARDDLITMLGAGSVRFSTVVARLLERHMIRQTDVKDICVELSKASRIENTWGSGNNKPRDESMIGLV